jgi:hypothetical protein
MTATQWLKMQLEIRSGIKEITVDSKTFEELCEQAKEMEKQQIIEAFIGYDSDTEDNLEVAEQYHNETYKNTNK